MYEEFYGLKEKTFNLNPDPDYFYLSSVHENALNHLEYTIAANKGFAVVTGEVGSGKTTLINYLLYHLQLDIHIGLINNTNIPASQLMKTICREFEIDVSNSDKLEVMDAFQEFLLQKYADSQRVLLIIDEAQNLPPKTLEEIRMISNLESEKDHLIQIILVGQPELKYKLQRDDLKQFAQRVSVYCHLHGLDAKEVGNYIRYRLKIGEAKNMNLFEEEAITRICEHTKGIPRLINVFCDTSLVYGFAEGFKTINKEIVESVIREREESGIFSNLTNRGFFNEPAAFGSDAKISAEDPSAGIIQQKLKFIESRLNDIENKLQSVEDFKNQRDEIIIESFKMIQESIKGRIELIQYIKKIQREKKAVEKNSKDHASVASNVSILKK
jgi:general secretion pathway protein A